MSEADKAGLQVTVHAIGDRANRTILDIYERVAGENGQRDWRFRVEHAQHLAQAEIPRFGELGVIPSMQPYHAIDDGRWVEGIIGPDRIKRTYASKSLLDSQAQLAFGSDWYVAPPSPILGIYAVVTRRTLDDKNPDGWVPEQKITVEQALTAYTHGSAYASFTENDTGRIAPGMLADLTLINRDLRQIIRQKSATPKWCARSSVDRPLPALTRPRLGNTYPCQCFGLGWHRRARAYAGVIVPPGQRQSASRTGGQRGSADRGLWGHW